MAPDGHGICGRDGEGYRRLRHQDGGAPSVCEHLTGRENLEIVRRLKGLSRRDADRAIEAMEISDYAAAPVREYSRGMRQRLGFRKLVQTLQQNGTAVLVSSHQLEELDLVANARRTLRASSHRRLRR